MIVILLYLQVKVSMMKILLSNTNHMNDPIYGILKSFKNV